jgi:hypothetical protein
MRSRTPHPDRRLVLPAHEAGGAASKQTPLPEQPPRTNRLRLPLQREIAEGFELELFPGKKVCRLADVGLAWRCNGFEALCENDGIPENAVVHPRSAADDPGDSMTRVDPHVEPESFCLRRQAVA